MTDNIKRLHSELKPDHSGKAWTAPLPPPPPPAKIEPTLTSLREQLDYMIKDLNGGHFWEFYTHVIRPQIERREAMLAYKVASSTRWSRLLERLDAWSEKSGKPWNGSNL